MINGNWYGWGQNWGNQFMVSLDEYWDGGGYYTTPRRIPQLEEFNIKKIIGTGAVSGLLTVSGDLYMWGDPEKYVFKGAEGLVGMSPVPTGEDEIQYPIFHSGGWKDVVIMRSDMLALGLKDNGDLYVWGYNSNGSLGLGQANLSQITPVLLMTGVKELCVQAQPMGEPALVLKENGEMWGWGRYIKDLFIDANASYLDYLYVPTLLDTGVERAWSGGDAQGRVFYIKNGLLYCIGSNRYGGLGIGIDPENPTTNIRIKKDDGPLLVNGTGAFHSPIAQIVFDWAGTMLRLENGDVYICGSAKTGYDYTGLGATANVITFTKLLEDIVEIYMPLWVRMARKADGTVFFWGDAYEGVFPDGNQSNYRMFNVPTPIPGKWSSIWSESGYGLFGVEFDGLMGIDPPMIKKVDDLIYVDWSGLNG